MNYHVEEQRNGKRSIKRWSPDDVVVKRGYTAIVGVKKDLPGNESQQ